MPGKAYSYSMVKTYIKCPYNYKLKYIDRLKTVEDTSPTNALFLGTACHTGIETRSVDQAIENYKSNFPLLTREHEIEILKLKTILPKAIHDIPEGEYEYKLSDDDGFVGYIDCLVPVSGGVYDLLDFKHTNNISKYKKTGQIHVYKNYYEKLTGNKIRDLYYVFIPKYEGAPLTLDMTDEQIKCNLLNFYGGKEIRFEKIDYNENQVTYFFGRRDNMFKETEFRRHPDQLCKYCDYFKYCSTNGKDTSELKKPKIEEIKQEELF